MNQLVIQNVSDEISRLQKQLEELVRADQAKPSPFYVCTRCQAMYQSIWGCGCINAPENKQLLGAASPAEGPTPESVKLVSNRPPTEAEIEYGKTLAPMAEECLARNAAAGPKPSPRCPKGRSWLELNFELDKSGRGYIDREKGQLYTIDKLLDAFAAQFFAPSAGEVK